MIHGEEWDQHKPETFFFFSAICGQSHQSSDVKYITWTMSSSDSRTLASCEMQSVASSQIKSDDPGGRVNQDTI